MKIKLCPRCNQRRFNNSPYSYVWWHIMGLGYMCWKCAQPVLYELRNRKDVMGDR